MAYELNHSRPIALGDRLLAGGVDPGLEEEIARYRKEELLRRGTSKARACQGPHSDALGKTAEVLVSELQNIGLRAWIVPLSEREWQLKLRLWGKGDLGELILYVNRDCVFSLGTAEVRVPTLRRLIERDLAPQFFGIVNQTPVSQKEHELVQSLN